MREVITDLYTLQSDNYRTLQQNKHSYRYKFFTKNMETSNFLRNFILSMNVEIGWSCDPYYFPPKQLTISTETELCYFVTYDLILLRTPYNHRFHYLHCEYISTINLFFSLKINSKLDLSYNCIQDWHLSATICDWRRGKLFQLVNQVTNINLRNYIW